MKALWAEGMASRLSFASTLLFVILVVGCDAPVAQPMVPSAPRVVKSPAVAAPQALREYWELQKLGGQRIGHSHTVAEQVQEDGRELIRTTSQSHSQIQRLGQTISQQVKLVSWDTAAGELVRCEAAISGAGGNVKVKGRVENNALRLELTTSGKTTAQVIPWQADWGGYFAAEESLRRQPLKPGEKRTLTALLPVLNQPGEITLVAEGAEEPDALPGLPGNLLQVHMAMKLIGGDRPVLEADQWLDRQGESHRSLITGIDQETLRVTREVAIAGANDAPVDVILNTIVPVAQPLKSPHEARRITYQAHVKSGGFEGLLVDCPSQRVKPLDDATAEIEVVALRPETKLPEGMPSREPTDADRTPNNLIQSDDAAVVVLAAKAAEDETDPWKVAVALEAFVKRTVKNKNFSQAMATAAEVARNLEGDCTEHAVLLAGLLRARKIPARVAIGLVYYPPQQGFAYHMWTEAWIGERWIPLDATLGRGGIGCGHLKLADSNLADTFASFLTVMQALGRLEVEVVSVEN